MKTDFLTEVQPLIDASCIDCHDASTDTALDFSNLPTDLSDEATFSKWVRVFDRARNGEMPPEDYDRPDDDVLQNSTQALGRALWNYNKKEQTKNGRVVLRRLTRTEYEYSLRDALDIESEIATLLPAENSSGMDTVADKQGISPLHIQSYLRAAEFALNDAINMGKKPVQKTERFPLKEFEGVRKHLDNENEHPILEETDDGVIMYQGDASYLVKVDKFRTEHTGRYRIRASARAVNSDEAVVLTLNAGDYKRGFQRVLGFWDVGPDEFTKVEVTTVLNSNEYLFPGGLDLDVQPDGKTIWNIGPEDYTGSGIEIQYVEVEGPLVEQWPPASAAKLLPGVEFKEREHLGWKNNKHIQFDVVPPENPAEIIEASVARLATLVFRRPLKKNETKPFVELAQRAHEDGLPFEEAAKIALRSVLCSPEFLFHAGKPGKLKPHALASRLSYFFWKSIPDQELIELADKGKLSQPEVLREQVERMLKDPNAERFRHDFVSQWLQTKDIDATEPDKKLYPEYDPILRLSMLSESEAFFTELLENDLSAENIIDSNFAMINRRLAEHYGIDQVQGQEIRKVELEADHPRGGVMTQAAVLKVTANGTVTSPVRRGAWVLTHLLGQPPSPPPPSIGSIEPDTRGTTTIREELAAHRNEESCALCHKEIDPPGFALESFDVIGGFREKYRSAEKGETPKAKLLGRNIWEYKVGLPVDATGNTPEGDSFDGIRAYKKLLLKQNDQVARNVAEQLIIYSTGAEIEFADRIQVDKIMSKCKESNYGLRTIIHEIVQSPLFLNK